MYFAANTVTCGNTSYGLGYTKKTWSDARDSCNADNLQLVTIMSEPCYDVVRENFIDMSLEWAYILFVMWCVIRSGYIDCMRHGRRPRSEKHGECRHLKFGTWYGLFTLSARVVASVNMLFSTGIFYTGLWPTGAAFVVLNPKIFPRAFGARIVNVKMSLKGKRKCERFRSRPRRTKYLCYIIIPKTSLLWSKEWKLLR